MRAVTGEAVAEWAGAKLGREFQRPYTAFGFLDRNDDIKGAVVFNDYYRGGNVGITYVGAHAFGREQIVFMTRFAFEELKASRLTARTRRSNKLMRHILPKFGFQFEFTQRRFYGPEKADDALVYVAFRQHAERWLRRD